MTTQEKQNAVATVLFETQKQGVKLFAKQATFEEVLEFIVSQWPQIEDAVDEADKLRN